jgi:hypothetical protein
MAQIPTLDAYSQSLTTRARVFDDGISGAWEIAEAVRSACAEDGEAVLSAESNECAGTGVGLEWCEKNARHYLERMFRDLSLQTVLVYRRVRK